MQLQAMLRNAEAEADGPVWFRAASAARDRHGSVIDPAGVEVEAYLRNPLVGWNHAPIRGGPPDSVIGRVESIERGADYLDVAITFADHERAKLTERLVRSGFLNAVSIGVLPRKTATRTIDGQRVPVVEKSELLEVSVVAVGSNPEALRIMRDIAGADASEEGEDMEIQEIQDAVT